MKIAHVKWEPVTYVLKIALKESSAPPAPPGVGHAFVKQVVYKLSVTIFDKFNT